MTDAADPNPTPSPTSDEMHWGVAYLRQQIQDVRQDLHEQIGLIHSRIDEMNKRMDSQFKWISTTMLLR